MRCFRRGFVAVAAAILAGSCAAASTAPLTGPSDSGAGSSIDEPTTPCEDVAPDCRAKRLPDVSLSEEKPRVEGVEALGPVDQPLEVIISFDQALAAAWQEDAQAAETVRVVLGSADSQAMHWESSGDLFYGIVWTGVCITRHGGTRIGSSSPEPTGCSRGDWGTIIDAHTGAFIVGGTG